MVSSNNQAATAKNVAMTDAGKRLGRHCMTCLNAGKTAEEAAECQSGTEQLHCPLFWDTEECYFVMPPPFNYEMPRTLTKISDLWQEFKVGLYGNPSIDFLDDVYGRRWRPSTDKFYPPRKTVITAVERYVEEAEGETREEKVAKGIERAEKERGRRGLQSYGEWLQKRGIPCCS